MVNFDQKLIFKFLIFFFVSILHQISINFWPILDFWLSFEIVEYSMVGTSWNRINYDMVLWILMSNMVLFQQVWKNPGQWCKRSVRFWRINCLMFLDETTRSPNSDHSRIYARLTFPEIFNLFCKRLRKFTPDMRRGTIQNAQLNVGDHQSLFWNF